MGFSTVIVFGAVGVGTAILSHVLTSSGKAEIAKQSTLAVELIMWGAIVTLMAADMTEAAQQIGSLGSLFTMPTLGQ